MRSSLHLFLSASAVALTATPALAQETTPSPQPTEQQDGTGATPAGTAAQQSDETGAAPSDIVVTARKRVEALLDVPVAATAITGEVIEKRGLVSARDIAALTPGLNINSDAAGRAFVAIRGVGVTLVDTVQPGVGIFIDGVYQQNTSYLNNPLVDVERVEVLRGPQGTLYGKNTLGGAINIITRQPSNELQVRAIGSYARPDKNWLLSGSVSGPIVTDRLQARIGYAHRQQEGFTRNTLLGTDGNPLQTDSLRGTIRALPAPDVILTVNGYRDWVKGASTPYAYVDGPTDYNREIRFNTRNIQRFRYSGINARLEFPLESLNTDVTLIGAYDRRRGEAPDSDLDFSEQDIARNSGTDLFQTRTAELRFDTRLSDTLSSIVGLFYSRETRDANTITTLFPGVLNLQNVTDAATKGDTYAAFGNIFWRPSTDWELSAGLRYDVQKRDADGLITLFTGVQQVTDEELNEKHLSPRVALTRHWNRNLMSYASISRGFRGGGFNSPTAPFRTYKGDNVWTYEAGTKYSSPDRRFSLAGAVFYNDYRDFVGLNSIAPAVTGGFTTVDLNSGDVRSYGVEVEGTFRPTRNWTLSGGLSLQHARLTNTDIYTELTGRTLASDRLPFQPDYNFNLNSDYTVPVGSGEVTWNIGLLGKGSRIAGSLSETAAPVLKAYTLVNTGLTYRTGPVEFTAFADNLFNKKFFESYIEKTTLILAGLTPTDVGIVGEGRRYGLRTRLRF
ncbi:TonB-dependent receptor [Sphingomonas sp. BN140010]|uniref:TonB-dependent receptor n=1 Tax=Sphingomonas arvum TaxID=2992113 RepID=A0ABT3JEW4_9SPHN|nr:TonB-dependent receptor [Sphingomonas sp. BN140010]MCW3797617.1 TonB-dependent receptor [Sphingomonas sp. BN140010]